MNAFNYLVSFVLYSKDSLKQAIMAIPFANEAASDLAAGLREMRTNQFTHQHGRRLGVEEIAIVITDGFDNKAAAVAEANLAAKVGISILSVGVTSRVEQVDLRDISARPQQLNQSYFLSHDFQNLVSYDDLLVARTCIAAAQSDCTNKVMDLVFVLDSSSFTGFGNWATMLNYVTALVNQLTIGDTATRVGVVSFADVATDPILLNTFNNKSALINAIANLPLINANGINIYAALKAMRTVQFTSGAGDRSDVPNVAILITEGSSTIYANEALHEAKLAHYAGISVYSVGLTDKVNENELRMISSHPHLEHHQWWTSANFVAGLENVINSISEEICRPDLGMR